ncbi:hypothetical protein AVEN_247853-1 [Araneus ventricosus]|uniref:Reverse transcriptase zinc-binding domain-containing protein n=1 Tax=Araneus ventricosus TaxID=182803 RepID=A0A4Y2IDQ1_ARAVE|nr:hypothetical protein AVEN_247853-1 [Araneus ventricosus]
MNGTKVTLEGTSTSSFQRSRLLPALWQRPEIMFATGHGTFPTYFKRFGLRTTDFCGCGELGTPLHFATICRFTSSYHFTKPSNDLENLWWKRAINNPLSRIQIRKLINFISKNGDISSHPSNFNVSKVSNY